MSFFSLALLAMLQAFITYATRLQVTGDNTTVDNTA